MICGFHRVVLEEPGLLSCCALWWVPFPQRFEETCRPYLPRYELIHGLVTLKMMALLILDISGSNRSTTQIKNPEAQFRNTKTGVQVLKFWALCLSQWAVPRVPLGYGTDKLYRLCRISSLSQLLHKRRWSVVVLPLHYLVNRTLRRRNPSLSVAYKHTLSGNVWQEKHRIPSSLTNALCKLYVTHSNNFQEKDLQDLPVLKEKGSNFFFISVAVRRNSNRTGEFAIVRHRGEDDIKMYLKGIK